MNHEMFDVWFDEARNEWQAQLVNFIGHFKTEAQARKYVETVKAYRAKK